MSGSLCRAREGGLALGPAVVALPRCSPSFDSFGLGKRRPPLPPGLRMIPGMSISIAGVDKVKLIQELYRGTSPLGMGFLHDVGDLTDEQARGVLNLETGGVYNPEPRPDGAISLDYVYGRPFKIKIHENELEGEWLYDRDAGAGRCAAAVERARAQS